MKDDKKFGTQEILSHVDHTNLKQTATAADIITLCQEGLAAGVASVCLPPCFVPLAVDYLSGRLPVCTVVGFPNGYQTAKTKLVEAEEALKNGASEIDMVIPIGKLKENNRQSDEQIAEEIRLIKGICGSHILKVIVETCFLTKEEKIRVCQIVSDSPADFIKTSTGFGLAGADLADIHLFRRWIRPDLQIKAAGGIRDYQEAVAFLEAGCQRLGSSHLAKLARNSI